MQGIARSLIALNELPLIEDANVDSYLTEARGMLFRERGFELYWEMVRRTDMIRFGKYEGTWTEKG